MYNQSTINDDKPKFDYSSYINTTENENEHQMQGNQAVSGVTQVNTKSIAKTIMSDELKQSLLRNPYLGRKGRALIESIGTKVLAANEINSLAINLDNIALIQELQDKLDQKRK